MEKYIRMQSDQFYPILGMEQASDQTSLTSIECIKNQKMYSLTQTSLTLGVGLEEVCVLNSG